MDSFFGSEGLGASVDPVEGVGEEEEGEALTAAQVFARMEELWLNERHSPDLRPPNTDVVDCTAQQLRAMVQNLARAKKNDLKTCIHRMEIERIRFVLSDYHRARLRKIEAHAAHLLAAEAESQEGGYSTQQGGRLTPEELLYARNYQSSVDAHFRTLALRHMPHNLQAPPGGGVGGGGAAPPVAPNLDRHVFMRVVKDVSAVVEEETDESREEVVDLKAGDQHVMRYKPLAALVDSGDVTLI